MRRVLAILLVSLICAGCGGSHDDWTYSPKEVITAFDSAGYPVIDPLHQGSATPPQGVGLVPRTGGDTEIFVASKELVDKAWADYLQQGGDADSLTIKRANVLFISDGGMSSNAKARTRRAMASLPERGFKVDVLEDR